MLSWRWRLMTVILATQEAEIWKIIVQNQTGQIVYEKKKYPKIPKNKIAQAEWLNL
jgi:hypothetical protein